VQFDNLRNPFLSVKLEAKLLQNCRFKVSPSNVIQFGGIQDRVAEFNVTVRPPATIVRVEAGGFQDELIIEAPLKKLDNIALFEFFRRTQVIFDLRYMNLSTDFTDPLTTVQMFPIFGGKISVPIWNNLLVGYSMYQNLTNLRGSDGLSVQYSEFAIELKYDFSLASSWGSPNISPVVDYRGRNVYQVATTRSFILGSTALPGGGIDFSWYFASLFSQRQQWYTRFGIDAGLRYYGGRIANNPYKNLMWEAVLNYRLARKWAVGVGYSAATRTADFDSIAAGERRISEPLTSFLFKVSLVPSSSRSRP